MSFPLPVYVCATNKCKIHAYGETIKSALFSNLVPVPMDIQHLCHY